MRNPNRKYRKAMVVALDKCRSSATYMPVSRFTAARCLKTFERINAVPFDPLNPLHVMAVTGMGPHEALHRKLRKLWKTSAPSSQSW